MRVSAESPFHGRCLLHLGTETRYPTLLATLFFGGILRMLRLRSSERAAKCNAYRNHDSKGAYPCAYFGYCH
jgi:hypothetical protein